MVGSTWAGLEEGKKHTAASSDSWLTLARLPHLTYTHLGSLGNCLCCPAMGRHKFQGCRQDAVLQLLLALIVLLLFPALICVPGTETEGPTLVSLSTV